MPVRELLAAKIVNGSGGFGFDWVVQEEGKLKEILTSVRDGGERPESATDGGRRPVRFQVEAALRLRDGVDERLPVESSVSHTS
jgi:hypothetical protein